MINPSHQKQKDDNFNVVLIITSLCAFIPYFLYYLSSALDTNQTVVMDTRHFVIWLRRNLDPDLFKNDIIADYFINMTPWMYKLLYTPFSYLGIDPVKAQEFILMPFSAVLFAISAYAFIYSFWPSPCAASITALSMLYLTGIRFDGLPHSFGYTFVILNLLAFSKKNPGLCFLSIFVSTAILQVSGLVSFVTICLMMLTIKKPYVTKKREDWICFANVCLGFIINSILTMYFLSKSGPGLSSQEARLMPLLNPGGYYPLWGETLLSTYFCNDRLGFLPFCGKATETGIVIWGLIVALIVSISILLLFRKNSQEIFHRLEIPSIDFKIIGIWTCQSIAGAVLFLIAHAFAFKFAQPERFIRYTTTLIFVSVTAIMVSIAAISIKKAMTGQSNCYKFLSILSISIFLILFSINSELILKMHLGITDNATPNINKFLLASPKNTLVAGLTKDLDNVPTFGQRSVLFAMDLFGFYKKTYYLEMTDRIQSFIPSFFSQNSSEFIKVQQKYGIKYLMIRNELSKNIDDAKIWLLNFPPLNYVDTSLKNGQSPFFLQKLGECTVASDGDLLLVDSACISKD